MFITRWSPVRSRPLFRELDEMYGPEERAPVAYRPAVDILEAEDHVLILADMPGLEEQAIEVKVEQGMLTLSGERTEGESAADSQGYRERRFGRFERSFRLGEQVDPAGIEARYTAGVLRVTLPKRAESKPRQIPVSSN